MFRLAAAVALPLAACASSTGDRAVVYSEESLALAELAWDAAYRARAEFCESKYEPKTPEMEDCFGAWYDADADVARALETSVAILRAYWRARAAGKNPSWAEVVSQINAALADLPKEAQDVIRKALEVR